MRRGGKRRVVGRWAQQAHVEIKSFRHPAGCRTQRREGASDLAAPRPAPRSPLGARGPGHRHGWSGPERVTPGLGFQIGFVALAKSGQDSAPEARGRRRDRKVLRSIGDTWPECQTEDKRTGAQRLGPAKISR
jgi:hypothetical protein